MASKYLQKYQVPEGFYDILHEFTREILRAQPDDILDYAANYFEHKCEGREYYYESKHNVQKAQHQKPKQYNPTPHSNYSEQAKRVVEASNARAAVEAEQQKNQAVNRQPSAASSKHNRIPSGTDQNGGARPLTSNSIKSDKPNDTSKLSHQSRKSDISHPEEKKISKEFVDDLYSSAIHQAIGSTHQDNQDDEEEEEQQQQDVEEQQEQEYAQTPGEPNIVEPAIDNQPAQAEEVILDGPVEEYENVALKIQSVFRGNKVRKGKKE